MPLAPVVQFKLFVGAVLYIFVPLTAVTYYFSRRKRRIIEVERVLNLLKVDPAYRQAYEPDTLSSYGWAVAYLSAVSAIGLTMLLFSHEVGLPDGEFPVVPLGEAEFPQKGSRIVFAMAFFGAYFAGLQHIYRRYSSNDLTPAVYYGSSMRMLLAGMTALIVYNAYTALSGAGDSSGGITPTIWPALAFLIGIFPQRGMRWITDRVPVLATPGDPSTRPMPLEMIEGVESHDTLRMEELGIDSCYDLATADFVPLLLRTPYSARQLIDWILQAKLCVFFGDTVKDLRRIGIRTLVDLESMTPPEIESLPMETSVIATVLLRARESVKSPEIDRLRDIGQRLGIFAVSAPPDGVSAGGLR
jgi:hypothetical protein